MDKRNPATPRVFHHGEGRKALATLLLGRTFSSVSAKRAMPSWDEYCRKFGFDLVVFDETLDDSPRAAMRSPAWQKCLVANSEFLKKYTSVCWIDADIIINNRTAPSIFDRVHDGNVGAVEGWASPTREIYRRFLSLSKEGADATTRDTIDDEASAYYSRFGLSTEYPTVVQTGVIVFDPNRHGPLFRDVYRRYEDRGPSWWHYEMRPLSYELHRETSIDWVDSRFNYNAICDLTVVQNETWPSRLSFLDKVAVRVSMDSVVKLFYQRELSSLSAALSRAWFLHFAGFRLGLRLASM